MTRDQRRRLLLRAHAAAHRFTKKAEAEPYFKTATDAFVAGWLLGHRARRLEESRQVKQILSNLGPLDDPPDPKETSVFQQRNHTV